MNLEDLSEFLFVSRFSHEIHDCMTVRYLMGAEGGGGRLYECLAHFPRITSVQLQLIFSTKVPIGDTIFTSLPGEVTAILRDHPSHAKV